MHRDFKHKNSLEERHTTSILLLYKEGYNIWSSQHSLQIQPRQEVHSKHHYSGNLLDTITFYANMNRQFNTKSKSDPLKFI